MYETTVGIFQEAVNGSKSVCMRTLDNVGSQKYWFWYSEKGAAFILNLTGWRLYYLFSTGNLWFRSLPCFLCSLSCSLIFFVEGGEGICLCFVLGLYSFVFFQQRTYRAMYDYSAQDEDEVSFRDGDYIINVQPIDDGWMYGTVQRTGKTGMLPANYIEFVNWFLSLVLWALLWFTRNPNLLEKVRRIF